MRKNYENSGTQGNFGSEQRPSLGVPHLQLNIRNVTRSRVERKDPGTNVANQTDTQTE